MDLDDMQELLRLMQSQQNPQSDVMREVLVRQSASDDEIILKESSSQGDKIGFVDHTCGCGKAAWVLKNGKKVLFTSWTGKTPCEEHVEYCHKCSKTLATVGNADGSMIYYKREPYWFCTNCYILAIEEIRSRNFWEGFKEGLLGGKTYEEPTAPTAARAKRPATAPKPKAGNYRPRKAY